MKRISMLFLAVLFATGYVFADSPRMILVEEFTNSANGNSANQNPVLQNFIENNSDKIIPIAFHMAQSDPEEDIFYLHNQAMSETRKNFYNIETPPMLLVNGKRTMAEDGSVSGMPADTAAIAREMNKYTAVSPIDITVTETRTGNNVQLNIDVASSTSLAGKKLRVAAAEFACTYPNGEAGPNGESQYYWVARKMYDNASGSTIIDDNFSRTINATIDSEWDANKIYFIVWIQDDSSKEVLQAATTMKPMAMMQINPNFADITDLFTKVKRNNSVSHDFTVMNDNSVDLEFKFSKLESMPEDWNVTISPETANIPAGGSTIVKVTINAGEQASFVSAGLEANIISNDYFSYAKNSIFYSLLEETKYVYYRTAEINHAYISGATNSYINAIYNTPSHKKDFAVLPFINQIFQAYNPLDFDCIIMNNITPSDVVTQTLPFNEVIPQLSNLMMQSGKGVLLISDVSGYWAFNDKDNRPEMYNFLYNKLGLEFAKNEDVVDFAQGQLFMREIKGTAGDPVTGGMNFTINGGYQQTGLLTFFYDVFNLKKDSKASKIFTSTLETIEYVVGVKLEDENKGRVIYTSAGFESSDDFSVNVNFMEKAITWLSANADAGGAKIEITGAENNAVAYGDVKINSNTSKTITLSNTGTKDLTYTLTKKGTNPSKFTLEGKTENTQYTIAPGETSDVVIVFAPTEEKEYAAKLSIETNDITKENILISLSGTGITDAVPSIDLVSNLEFSATAEAAEKTIVLTNSGTGELNISAIMIAGNDADVFEIISNQSGTVAAGETFDISVRFTPTATKIYTATLTVKSNIDDVTVAIKGEGTTSVLDAWAGSVEFASVNVGPNPVVETATVNYTIGTKAKIFDLHIIDANGNFVAQLVKENTPVSGDANTTFSVANMASGKYFIVANTGNYKAQLPFVIAK